MEPKPWSRTQEFLAYLALILVFAFIMYRIFFGPPEPYNVEDCVSGRTCIG